MVVLDVLAAVQRQHAAGAYCCNHHCSQHENCSRLQADETRRQCGVVVERLKMGLSGDQ